MDTEAWGTTTSLAELAAWLADCRRIVAMTHVKPDGDAVGSTLAVVRALNLSNPFAKEGPRAEAWYFGPMPPWLTDVAGATPHRVLGKEGPPAHTDPEAVVILDTGSWMQLEAAADWLRARSEVCAVIDHHVQGDADVAALRVVDTRSAAVCQPAAELCRMILSKRTLAEIDPTVATALYLGLATDTGWFRHSNVDRAVMLTAGDLIQAGARHVWLHQTVEQRDTPGRLRLMARALASLEIVPLAADGGGAHAALMTLTRKDFEESGAAPGESGGFVDITQGIPAVKVTVLLTEVGPEEFGAAPGVSGGGPPVMTKVSMRSKQPTTPGDESVDVNAAAKEMGGGGHVRAAGARVPAGLAETRRLVVEAMRKHVSRA